MAELLRLVALADAQLPAGFTRRPHGYWGKIAKAMKDARYPKRHFTMYSIAWSNQKRNAREAESRAELTTGEYSTREVSPGVCLAAPAPLSSSRAR